MPEHLFDHCGRRKYLTADERAAFLKAAEQAPQEIKTLCHVLAYTGCRISEALALTVERIDFAGQMIVFESLKKRRRGVFRAVPVPPQLLKELDAVHRLHSRQGKNTIWALSRLTAWRHIKVIMAAAGIEQGPQASPRGLRHGFGVAAVSAGVPLNLVQKWLGHAQISTTAIYANALGAEERNIAARMWG